MDLLKVVDILRFLLIPFFKANIVAAPCELRWSPLLIIWAALYQSMLRQQEKSKALIPRILDSINKGIIIFKISLNLVTVNVPVLFVIS